MSSYKDIATFIFEDISQKILSLEYIPGMAISENDICEMYGASRTPVRTALQRLADKNLIDLLPYQKTRVSKVDLNNVEHYIYARACIEERVIKDFINLKKPLLIEDVEHLIRKQQIVIDNPEYSKEQFFDLDTKMHRLWFESVNQLPIWDYIQNSIHYTRQRKLDILDNASIALIIDEHFMLLEAIKSGDTSNLYNIIHSHLYGGINRVKNAKELTGYFA